MPLLHVYEPVSIAMQPKLKTSNPSEQNDSESRTSPAPHAPSWSFISRAGSRVCLTA